VTTMGANEKAAATYHPNDTGHWLITLVGPSPITPAGYELGRGVAEALQALGWTPPKETR